MTAPLPLIGHPACPQVKRAVIALTGKGIAFDRTDTGLAARRASFVALSHRAGTPVLRVCDMAIFELAGLKEYLEETTPRPLHPQDPVSHAQARAGIEVASAVLIDGAGLYP